MQILEILGTIIMLIGKLLEILTLQLFIILMTCFSIMEQLKFQQDLYQLF